VTVKAWKKRITRRAPITATMLPCKAPMVYEGYGPAARRTYCREPAEYVVWWRGGCKGTSECKRPLCEKHAQRWARRQRLALPADSQEEVSR